jgi:hypothetical protein
MARAVSTEESPSFRTAFIGFLSSTAALATLMVLLSAV